MQGIPTNKPLFVNSEISLIPLSTAYADEFFCVTNKNREHLKRWLPWLNSVKKPQDSANFIEYHLQMASQRKSAQFIIDYQNHLIGITGFHNLDNLYHHCEIGYWLDQDFCGQGIMTQSVKALLFYGFNDFSLRKITIRCATTNRKSRKIPERLGFKLESKRKHCEWLYDHYVDHAIYALYFGDYEQYHDKPRAIDFTLHNPNPSTLRTRP